MSYLTPLVLLISTQCSWCILSSINKTSGGDDGDGGGGDDGHDSNDKDNDNDDQFSLYIVLSSKNGDRKSFNDLLHSRKCRNLINMKKFEKKKMSKMSWTLISPLDECNLGTFFSQNVQLRILSGQLKKWFSLVKKRTFSQQYFLTLNSISLSQPNNMIGQHVPSSCSV